MDLSEGVDCVGNFENFEPEVMSVISISVVSVVVEFGASVFVAEVEAEDDFFLMLRSRASLENACMLSGAAGLFDFDSDSVLWPLPREALTLSLGADCCW